MIVNKMGRTITDYDFAHRHIRFIYVVILCLCGITWYIIDVLNFDRNAYEASLDEFVSRKNWMLVSDYGIDSRPVHMVRCATAFFLSHGMGCMDVNDAVHMVRLQYIFFYVQCVTSPLNILCDCNCDSKKTQSHIAPYERAFTHDCCLCLCS